ncbi:MAG TPA: glycosyltransferase family protein [Gemmatimonadales bacterium]|nr:glycosyltransferase family protein [Gemmatimonadales bacterium]
MAPGVVTPDRVVTIVQARCASSRLPGKVLLPLSGATVLERMVERVGRARLGGAVVVATTTAPADDAIEAVCRRAGIFSYRGHPTDLLDRHYQVARALGANHIVKVPSDCALIDPRVIDRVIAFYLAHRDRYDYVSNLHPPTYPDGNDVEICSFGALEIAWREATRALDREHTTPFLWDHPERFRIGNVVWDTGLDLSISHRVVLDYAEDYEVIRRVADALAPSNAFFGVAEIARYLDEHPDVRRLNAGYRGVNWYRHHLTELRTVSAADTRSVPEENSV